MKRLPHNIQTSIFLSIFLVISFTANAFCQIVVPDGYNEIISDIGVTLLQKEGENTYVQVVEFDKGAKIISLEGALAAGTGDDIGYYGGFNPKFERHQIYDWWDKFITQIDFEDIEFERAFTLLNGVYYNCEGVGCVGWTSGIAPLSFPLIENYNVRSGGDVSAGFNLVKFNINDDEISITDFNEIGGVETIDDEYSFVGQGASFLPGTIGRNYWGILDEHTLIIVISDAISHENAVSTLGDFGVASTNFLAFDGGGSVKLMGRSIENPDVIDYYLLGIGMVDFLRAIPQVFGIIAGEPDDPGGGEILSPPVNDNPCNATLLPVYFDCTPTWGDNIDATNSAIPLAYCPGDGFSYDDIWYKLTIPITGEVIIAMDEGSIDDCAMSVYLGTCTSMTEIDCDASSSPLSDYMPFLHLTDLPGGQTLWIRIWEFNNNDFGTFQICAYGIDEGGDPEDEEPDLIVEILNLEDDDVYEGEETYIIVNVINDGSEWCDNSEVAFYFSTDIYLDEGEDELIEDLGVAELDPGDDDEETLEFNVPYVTYTGPYYIIVKADSDNDVDESNEGNNTAWIAFEEVEDLGTGLADLSPEWYEIHPTPAAPGTEIYIEYWIHNFGESAVPIDYYTKYYLSADSVYDETDVFLLADLQPDIPADFLDYDSEHIIIPPDTDEGMYFILIFLDKDNIIVESNEGNNVDCIPLEISTDVYDFSPNITYINFDTASYNWDVELEINLTNNSIIETDVIHTGLYLSMDSIFDNSDTYLSQATESEQPAGEDWTETPDFDVPEISFGNYYIIVYVDHDELNLEYDENNNFDYVPFTISPPSGLPDLVAHIDSIKPNVITADASNTGTIHGRMTNEGFDLCNSSSARWYLSNDTIYNIGDIYLYPASIGSLMPGEQSNYVIGGSLPERPAGLYYLLYYADFNNTILEESEENNVAHFPLYYITAGECFFASLVDTFNLSSSVHTETFSFSTLDDCTWSISTNDDWINILSPFTGTGSSYVTFQIEENLTPFNRIGHILINDSMTIEINQEGINGFIDLNINLYDITPDILENGFTFEASYFASNLGDVSIPISLSITFYLSYDSSISEDDYILDTVDLNSILAGESIFDDPTITIPDSITPGNYQVIASIDDTNIFYESNEFNNTDCESIEIIGQTIDMTLTNVINPSTGCELTDIEVITLEGQNIGSSTILAVELSYQINEGEIITETATVEILPEEYWNFSFENVADFSVPGLHHLKCWVSVENDLNSINDTLIIEINNQGVITLITSDGPLSFCKGENVVLFANYDTAYTYQWKRNGINLPATSSSYSVSKTGNYQVEINNGVCMEFSDEIAVTVYNEPKALINNLDETNDLCIDSNIKLKANNGVGLSWQWKKDGVNITGATNIIYQAIEAGSYRVKVTNPQGCTKISEPFLVLNSCKENNRLINNVSIYPNPNTGKFILTFELTYTTDIEIEIFDNLSKTIFSEINSNFIGKYEKQFEYSNLSKGIYLVKINIKGENYFYKVVIQ